LHPPELDELGLVAAMRDYVLEADGEGLSTGLQVTVHGPAGGLPPLGAAVGVAAQVFLELTAREREVLELIAQGFSNH
jgi:DNA-binding NarL/FixJ family response regulator